MRDHYFLGGRDLEMQEIARLLADAGVRYTDHALAWGARLSDYGAEIEAANRRGETAVAIELQADMPPDWIAANRVAIVDHHGPLAGTDRPTALEQVFARLALPKHRWTRRLALVAANDRAHVRGLLAADANPAEIAAIRAEDRAAQGVTTADEAEAIRAVEARRTEGRVTIVRTASSTSSAIADRIMPELGGPGYDRLLVIMPERLAAFADGAAIEALARKVPQSWWGGDLPRAGYWGCQRAPGDDTAVIEAIAMLR